jgi:hypothetical protein
MLPTLFIVTSSKRTTMQQQHHATVQLVTNMNNTKSNFLQNIQWQWYQLTFYTFNGCIFTPMRCKIVKLINNQPNSGPFCCFVNNMTKSYKTINNTHRLLCIEYKAIFYINNVTVLNLVRPCFSKLSISKKRQKWRHAPNFPKPI